MRGLVLPNSCKSASQAPPWKNPRLHLNPMPILNNELFFLAKVVNIMHRDLKISNRKVP